MRSSRHKNSLERKSEHGYGIARMHSNYPLGIPRLLSCHAVTTQGLVNIAGLEYWSHLFDVGYWIRKSTHAAPAALVQPEDGKSQSQARAHVVVKQSDEEARC
jgi:hypothetical protein